MQNKLVAHAVSDIGRVRSSNQDGGYTGYQLHFVADGMGGHAGGDIASAMVTQHVAQVDALYATTEDAAAALLGAMLESNAKLGDTVDKHNALAGMGTTFSGVMFTADKAVIAHIGDSRVYLARNGEVRQVTKDHTFVQRLVDRGYITAAEALVHPKRNVIMRVLGDTEDAPNIDSWVEDALPGDRWMMCSDGLCGYVDESVIERNLLAKAAAADVAQDLVGETLEAGAPDNVTVVVVDVLSPNAATEDSTPEFVGSAANDVVITERRGRGVPMLFNTRSVSEFFSRNEDPTDFVPESEEFLAKVLAETNKRIMNRRLRQVLTYLAIAAIAFAALWAGYEYTQTKFYVGEYNGRIAIYKGIKESLGPLKFSSVFEETTVELSTLTEYQRTLVDRTIFATDIDDAHRIVSQVTKAVEK